MIPRVLAYAYPDDSELRAGMERLRGSRDRIGRFHVPQTSFLFLSMVEARLNKRAVIGYGYDSALNAETAEKITAALIAWSERENVIPESYVLDDEITRPLLTELINDLGQHTASGGEATIVVRSLADLGDTHTARGHTFDLLVGAGVDLRGPWSDQTLATLIRRPSNPHMNPERT